MGIEHIDILQLIPQRPPIVEVDKLLEIGEDFAVTQLTIQESNIFLRGNQLQASGLIEHIAQSAAALVGYKQYVNKEKPQIGYIGEIRNFNLAFCPEIGKTIQTTIKVLATAGGISLINGETTCENQPLCHCQMKIFLKQEND